MANPFTPTHDLYVIPMKKLEKELKTWFRDEKKINLVFEFGCEGSESSFGHMGDLYFTVDEEATNSHDLKLFYDLYPDDTWENPLEDIFEDFFERTNVSYDVHPYDEEVYIKIEK